MDRFFDLSLRGYSVAFQAISDNAEAIVSTSAGLLCALVVFLCVRQFSSRARGRRETQPMTQKDFRDEQKSVEDGILDLFEDLEDLGVLSRKRTKYWFKQFGQVGLTGLIHKHRIRTVSKKLKGRIRYRLKNGVYKSKPSIPGTPGEPNGVYREPATTAKANPKSKTERSRKLVPGTAF